MFKITVNKKRFFDLLPNEMVIFALSFVDVDTLLNCRLVCKNWRSIIDANVFQEKASRENEFVNNGKGFYSFSQISPNTVGKLEYPWYVFYAICKYDPFHRNLVQNHCGQGNYNNYFNIHFFGSSVICYLYNKCSCRMLSTNTIYKCMLSSTKS